MSCKPPFISTIHAQPGMSIGIARHSKLSKSILAENDHILIITTKVIHTTDIWFVKLCAKQTHASDHTCVHVQRFQVCIHASLVIAAMEVTTLTPITYSDQSDRLYCNRGSYKLAI